MPVTSNDFIVAARAFLSQESEAAYRSSISRAYYALYHAALEKAIAGGYCRERMKSTHKQLVEHVAIKDLNLSRKLNAKKMKRHHADYELNRAFTRRDAELEVAECERIVKMIEQRSSI